MGDAKNEIVSLSIHNWSLQPLNQDYDLTSHTTYVNFYAVDSERQIFESFL